MRRRKLIPVVLAIAVCCGLASSAYAGFIAYNDLIDPYGGGAGTTNHYAQASGGELLDYAGNATGVQLHMPTNGGFIAYPGQGYRFGTAGTDGYIAFEGIDNLSAEGVWSYGAPSYWYCDYNFSGLDPNREYRVVMSGTRASSSNYTTRVTKHTITGADAATQASSALSNSNVLGRTATVVDIAYGMTSQRWADGSVASWTDIDPGADGAFTIEVTPAGEYYGEWRKAYIPNVLLLEELPPPIPEPAGLGLLGVALLAMRRRRS